MIQFILWLLPESVKKWLRVVSFDYVMNLVVKADDIRTSSGEQKKEWVSKQIYNYCHKKGFVIPKPVVNFIIELAYTEYLKRKNK